MTDRRSTDERRAGSERRNARERRRIASECFTVIEIAGSELRVAMLDRADEEHPDRVQAIRVPWRLEAKSLYSEDGREELTSALRSLVEDHQVPVSNLQFVLSGEFCVTKAVRGTSEEVRSELQRLEQRSRLYLMLGPGEKVTVCRTEAIDARHQYAVAAVCNRKTIETIHAAASQAGMQIDSIEPALISSSRVIGRMKNAPADPCLLVHLDSNTVELGICYEGRLLLDYRPGGETEPAQLVEHIRTHLNRLQRHVGRLLHQPPPSLKQVYLSGDEASVESALPAFVASRVFDAQRIAPGKVQATWDFDTGVESSITVAALGALLSTYLPRGEQDAPNFMEHIFATTREPLRPVLIRSLLPLAVVLLLAAGMLGVNLREQSSINSLRQKVDQLTLAVSRDRELRLQSQSSTAKLEQLRGLASQLKSLPIGMVVARIGHCMPNDIWLNSLTIEDMRVVRLLGSGYQEAGVFDFVNWLEQAPCFKQVALRSTQPGSSPSGPTTEFTVELNLDDWDGPVEEVARNE